MTPAAPGRTLIGRGATLTTQGAVAQESAGLYAILRDETETAQAPGAALGPFDELTIRSARAVGERAEVGTLIAAHAANGRWRAVDPDLQHVLEVPGGDATRGDIRVYTTNRDLYVRVFDEPERSATVGEIGPFSVADVGTHTLRADDAIVAVRVSPMGPWLLTDKAGADLGGIAKLVLTLRASAARPASVPRPPTPVVPAETRAGSHPASEPAVPFVWVDRVRPVQEIYISRPDPPRKR